MGDGWQSSSEENQKCRVCGFPLIVALLQLLLGISVTAVAFLMLTISSSLLARETPHWAGMIMILVSILGFVLYCVSYQTEEKTSTQFIIKLLYFISCTVGVVVSVLAVAFAGHHHSQTSCFHCQETEGGCACTLDQNDPIARAFLYQGVSDCEVVTGTLSFYFLLQIFLNLSQALVCLVGAFVMWKHRYQVFFSGLQIGPPQQWRKV